MSALSGISGEIKTEPSFAQPVADEQALPSRGDRVSDIRRKSLESNSYELLVTRGIALGLLAFIAYLFFFGIPSPTDIETNWVSRQAIPDFLPRNLSELCPAVLDSQIRKLSQIAEAVPLFLSLGVDAQWFNRRDAMGTTLLQSYVYEGEVEAAHAIIRSLPFKPLPANRISAADLRRCAELPPQEIPLDEIDPNALVAQNLCSTVVRKKNGDILSLSNVKAADLIRLLQKRQGVSLPLPHSLKVYLHPEHAFVTFERAVGSFIEKMAVGLFGPRGLQNELMSLYDRFESRLIFPLTEEQGNRAYEYILKIAACVGQSCYYRIFGRNCVDFANEVFQTAQGNPDGHFIDYFHPEQVSLGNAAFYAFYRRSLEKYL